MLPALEHRTPGSSAFGTRTDYLGLLWDLVIMKAKLSSGLLSGIRFWSLCLILIFSGLAFRGVKWKTNALLTALLCLGIVFADLFIMMKILWMEGSSAVISFATLLDILTIWFGISVPLTFFGAYFGNKEKISCPVHTNQITCQIPP
ncbi:transmembrane 9 superfamily member 2-like [Pongo abelii]|uniref:transmembrane 9 superfamily member 2-like n=1 Tax=Pongo abelii TaxID=9601 RepID=UPI0023E84123|nr:transmembrane 9 superfamily member 2-like [Pongo abelii]